MGAGIANALLVQGARSQVWVTNPTSISTWGRIEDTISIGEVADTATLTAVGNAILNIHSQPRTSTTVEFLGNTGVPGFDFKVDDSLSLDDGVSTQTVRCKGITYTWDINTNEVVSTKVPELSSPLDAAESEVNRSIERLIANSGGSSLASSAPLSLGTDIPIGRVKVVDTTPWSWATSDDLDYNPTGWQPWVCTSPLRLLTWMVQADKSTATSNSKFRFWVNGVVANPLLTLEMSASETYDRVEMYGYAVLYRDDVIYPACTKNGGHSNGSIQFRTSEII